MVRRRKAIVVDSEMLSASVRSLRFRTADGSPVGHVAGQYLDLVVPTSTGLSFRRAYSIASPPDPAHPDVFEVAVTRVDGGTTSAALLEMGSDAIVEIEGPRGAFVRSEEDRAHPGLFVAAGTGLAPIRAMLSEDVRRGFIAKGGPPLVLLFGCRTRSDVLWRDELRSWEENCPRFRLHVTLSRPDAEWTKARTAPEATGAAGASAAASSAEGQAGLVGHVQNHVERFARSLPRPRVYVCGVSAMVDDVVTLLRSVELPEERSALRYEAYG